MRAPVVELATTDLFGTTPPVGIRSAIAAAPHFDVKDLAQQFLFNDDFTESAIIGILATIMKDRKHLINFARGFYHLRGFIHRDAHRFLHNYMLACLRTLNRNGSM